jgi:hypothetical protein
MDLRVELNNFQVFLCKFHEFHTFDGSDADLCPGGLGEDNENRRFIMYPMSGQIILNKYNPVDPKSEEFKTKTSLEITFDNFMSKITLTDAVILNIITANQSEMLAEHQATVAAQAAVLAALEKDLREKKASNLLLGDLDPDVPKISDQIAKEALITIPE